MSSDRLAALAASWTTNADAWTAAVREGRIPSRRAATDAAIVAATLAAVATAEREARSAPPSERPRVLDVGCGEGWLARALAAQGIDVVGVDASPPLVAAARAAGGGRFEVLDYAHAAAEPARLGGPFDAAVCNFALLDADPVPLLAALRARLAPGGAVLVQTVHPWTARGDAPYADGWRTETFAGFGDGFTASMPWFYRTLGSWLSCLDAAGLRVARLEEPVHPETGAPLSLLLTARA